MMNELLDLLKMSFRAFFANTCWPATLVLFAIALVSSILTLSALRKARRESGYYIEYCPHCGAAAEFRTFTNYDGECSYESGAVVCTCCGAQSKEQPISSYYGMEVSPQDIIRKWSRRR